MKEKKAQNSIKITEKKKTDPIAINENSKPQSTTSNASTRTFIKKKKKKMQTMQQKMTERNRIIWGTNLGNRRQKGLHWEIEDGKKGAYEERENYRSISSLSDGWFCCCCFLSLRISWFLRFWGRVNKTRARVPPGLEMVALKESRFKQIAVGRPRQISRHILKGKCSPIGIECMWGLVPTRAYLWLTHPFPYFDHSII